MVGMRSRTRTAGVGGQQTFGICEEEDVLAMGGVVAAGIACMGASGMVSNKQLVRALRRKRDRLGIRENPAHGADVNSLLD
jgi:hypothetical protein